MKKEDLMLAYKSALVERWLIIMKYARDSSSWLSLFSDDTTDGDSPCLFLLSNEDQDLFLKHRVIFIQTACTQVRVRHPSYFLIYFEFMTYFKTPTFFLSISLYADEGSPPVLLLFDIFWIYEEDFFFAAFPRIVCLPAYRINALNPLYNTNWLKS